MDFGDLYRTMERTFISKSKEIPENIKYHKLKVKITVKPSQYDMSFYMWGNYMVDFTDY